MGLTDYKVSEGTFALEGISALPDRPSANGISAAALKAAFDNLSKNYVGAGLNGVIDLLTSGEGAAQIGIEIEGMQENTVQDVLANIAQQCSSHFNDANNPHGLTAQSIGALSAAALTNTLTNNENLVPSAKAVFVAIAEIASNITEVVTQGDMLKTIYDPQGNNEDIFAYAQTVAYNEAQTVQQSLEASKQDVLSFDNTPTEDSTAMVTSGAIKSYVDGIAAQKAPAYTYGTTDLTAGESTLATGVLYFVYE